RNFSGHGDLMAATFGAGFDPFVGFSYSTPYLLGSNRTGFGFTINYSKLRNLADVGTAGFIPGYSQTSLNIVISLSRRLSLFQQAGGYVEYNSYSVDDKTLDIYPSSTISPDGKDQFFSAGLFYRYQQFDFVLFPMEGFYLNLTAAQIGLAGSSDKIGFTRGSIDVRFYQRLIGDLSIGLRNYSLISTNNPIPNHQRLLIGFTTQIRGYTSTILNGDNIQLNSVELRHPIIKLNAVRLSFIPIERLSVLQYGLFMTAFLDGGTIWYNRQSPAPAQRLTRFSFSDYKYGYGVGLVLVVGRWTARLDAAFNERGNAELVFEKTVSF
ncbi:MAG: BamA/TamA family outer membrane protein, partial [Desulfobulbaceae bacterium]|nr:BamA/TamA family outer membrane protein [Desulfobulbaceae bacterium]